MGNLRQATFRLFGFTLILLAWTAAAPGQGSSAPDALSAVPGNGQAVASATAAQTAKIFGLSDLVEKLRTLRAERGASTAPTIEERMIRLDLFEAIQTATLETDDVVGVISNERNQLGDLRTALQVRRDKTVGHLTTAALLTGSGVGAIVSATQFSTLGSTTQNVGDGVGIGSGVLSTLLSIQAARKQAGPSAPVGESPNMLAPLLVDASSTEALQAFLERHAPVDDLVLTLSGGKGLGRFRELDLSTLMKGFEGKFFTQIRSAQLALPFLSKDASITFVTAISARAANPGTAGLAAINGAIESELILIFVSRRSCARLR